MISWFTTVLRQAWTLLWYKNFIQNWRRASLWHMLSCLVLDVAVPVLLVYIYLANIFLQRSKADKKPKYLDPTRLKESMDQMMSNMLLPAGFFMFCRKVIGQIVLEKEKGLIEYLKMNGMKEAAYNLSFVLHESLINGLLICLALDLIVYKRQPEDAYTVNEMVNFNVATVLFLIGITTLSLLISKAFSSPGFATQIGSMIYLVPIFLSLYLKVLEMKHSFSKQANESFSAFEDDRIMAREKYKQAELRARLNESTEEDLQLYPRLRKNHHEATDGNHTLINDKQYIWETFAQKSLIISPHTIYCDLAASIFASLAEKASTSHLCKLYMLQVADFFFLFSILLIIENWHAFYKGIKGLCSAKSQKKEQLKMRSAKDGRGQHESLDTSEDPDDDKDDGIVSTSQGRLGLARRKQYQGGRADQSATRPGSTPLFEATDRPTAVEFVQMSKKFGSFVAVDDLSLKLYRDEIFCFLGHNGAGKTTSLNVLMGKTRPSSGTVKLSYTTSDDQDHHQNVETILDIREDAQQAQSLMGTCSQHDILFETLSIEQHMYLFFKLKESLLEGNLRQAQRPINQRIDELIRTVQLDEHRHKESQNLSGGMRRRLSIALALVSPSESSIVILDEPTTGLDAMVREDVWQLIKKLRHNRCIVMTTQHLQEAEELADQVALLDMGQMRAKGSVDEIKKQFGIGYNLIINHPQPLDGQFEHEAEILARVNGSFLDEKMSNEMRSQYTLPFQAVDTFPDLFEYLESQNVKFNLKQTSLEDAFLNFTNIQKLETAQRKTPGDEQMVDDELQTWENFNDFSKLDGGVAPHQISALQMFSYQFQAMFFKRWYSFKRDWRMWLIMILPSAIIGLFLMLGFQREYTPSSPIKYANQILGEQFTGNLTQYGTELTHNLTSGMSPLTTLLGAGHPDTLSGAIKGLSEFTMHGDRNKSLNLTLMGQRVQDSVNHPTMENMMKTLMTLSQGEGEETDDPELKELQELVKDILKEDLKLETPFDMLTFGMKLMAGGTDMRKNKEMIELQERIQDRMQAYYQKKMAPLLRQMAREQAELMMVEAIRYMKEIIYLIWIVFSLAQCSGIAVEHPVLEREIQMRYYLNVIGIGQAAYWCGNFAFDIICYYFQASIMVGLVYPLKLPAYQKEIKSMIALMALFGPAHTLFSYFISFAFSKPQSALKFISIAYMLSGFVIPFVFKMISLGVDRCEGWVYIASQIVSQGIPLHPMSQGLIDLLNKGHWAFFDEQLIKKREVMAEARERIKNDNIAVSKAQQIFLDYQTCDGYVVDVKTALEAMAFSCISSIFLIIFIERFKLLYYQASEKSYEPTTELDESGANYCLQTKNLTKVYSGKIQAVKSVSFNLNNRSEVLGLLGANGAGKSSTFNMVTMQIKRTSGDIQIFDKQIQNISSLEGINITAQQDILWPYLSIEEHLQVISLVQGNKQYKNRHKVLTQMLELDKPHKHALILSGGNKRKLCTAMTMMTGPKLAFFDEPTVGLDPVARRCLLDLIKKSGAPVLFTTHRLDEAEYLCTRVAIMKHGQILYDGAIEGIKESFQAGNFSQQTKGEGTNELAGCSATCQGLILVKEPVTDLTLKLDYVEIDQQGQDQALYRILQYNPKTGQKILMSQIFTDLSHLKSKEGGQVFRDFTYYQPSLHHAFVAINQQQDQL